MTSPALPSIWFMKVHPPAAVLGRRQPVTEEYRYDWEPLAARLLAWEVDRRYSGRVAVAVWHLMDRADDRRFARALAAERPAAVAFSEIDLLVPGSDRLAAVAKRLVPGIVTLVGGKHSSLLRVGDPNPFRNMDAVIGGDGVPAVLALADALASVAALGALPGQLLFDSGRHVVGRVPFPAQPASADVPTSYWDVDGIAMRRLPLLPHPAQEYWTVRQRYPAAATPPVRTASVLAGTGCPYSCDFCQSPAEDAASGQLPRQRDPEGMADEIAFLLDSGAADSFFLLHPNLDFGQVAALQAGLRRRGYAEVPLSGFVRADDVLRAERDGLLADLAAGGLRFLSIGLDAVPGVDAAVYGKGFGWAAAEECLDVCDRRGIAVLATVIADADIDERELRRRLGALARLRVADVDVRLAMAIRNTRFWDRLSARAPITRRWFERQNYRWQTIRYPGKIKPAQTYRAVAAFRRELKSDPERLEWIADFCGRHPRFAPFFERQLGALPPRAGYDRVACKYANAFRDIRVRGREVRWLRSALRSVSAGEPGPTLLDIGCGAGGLLRLLAPSIGRGIGVDVSEEMLAEARLGSAGLADSGKLEFRLIDGPRLPFPDASFDAVISFLSYRYTDRDRLAPEILRVLKPGGVFICVDMVADRTRFPEWPRALLGRVAAALRMLVRPEFGHALRDLVRDPAWRLMRARYPLRPRSEYTEHAALHFPDAVWRVLSVGRGKKVVALDARKT